LSHQASTVLRGNTGEARKDLEIEKKDAQPRLLQGWLSWESACYVKWRVTPPIFGQDLSAMINADPAGVGE
jgi:hypothetical protein